MKTQIRIIQLVLVTIFFSIMMNVFAQGDNTPQNPNKPPRGPDPQLQPPPTPPPPTPVPLAPENARQQKHFGLDIPDLTREQQDKIKKADLKHLSAMTPLRNQRREKSVRLATILSTNPVNLKDAEAIADEIGLIDAAILKQQIRHDQELRSHLTPDQQIIFDARPKPFITGEFRLNQPREK
jgi:Spy/CpxP family protein refolding chaperone